MNGVEEDSKSFSNFTINSTSPLEIGALPGQSGEDFIGQVQDVAVYDQAIFQGEADTLDSDHPEYVRGDTTIQGNLIGLQANGSPLGNTGSGVVIGTAHARIGGAGAGEGNVIAANTGVGVSISADEALVEGNDIGTGPLGSESFLGNGDVGVLVVGGLYTQIGRAGAGNVISDNAGGGVEIANSALDNVVSGNRIGTDGSGLSPLPNQGFGVSVEMGSTGATIGGASTADGNVISANHGDGIDITGASNDVLVMNNDIGVGLDGTRGLANFDDGISIVGSSSAQIGGDSGNIIANNTGDGVSIAGLSTNHSLGNDAFSDGQAVTQSQFLAAEAGSGPPFDTLITSAGDEIDFCP